MNCLVSRHSLQFECQETRRQPEVRTLGERFGEFDRDNKMPPDSACPLTFKTGSLSEKL